MSTKDKTKIYVFHYKPEHILSTGNEYVHIWAGKNGEKEVEGFVGDDSGDNISSKNKYYSELTGLYWIWKNTRSDIVGSCHYRRYFTTSLNVLEYKLKRLLYYPTGLWRKRYGLIYTKNLNFWKSKFISKDEVSELLKSFDAILPTRRKFKYTVKEHYRRYHDINDLEIIEKILKCDYPEYLPSYESIMADNRLFANNMFILKWELFDELMTWLFEVLFKYEEEVDLSDYSDYQERIFGFLSERLITLWVYHKKLNYKELHLVYFKKMIQR